MKKKYIITGLLVFLFSAIAIYLVLDTGKQTYAVEQEPIEDENGAVSTIEALCTANGHGQMVGNKCVCDSGYSITTSSEATCQKYTLKYQSNDNYNHEYNLTYGYVFISWASSINQQMACNALKNLITVYGRDTFEWDSTNSKCKANVYADDINENFHYYGAADLGYCYSGYEYDANLQRCYNEIFNCPNNLTVEIKNINSQRKAYIRKTELSEGCCTNTIGFDNYTNDDEAGICTTNIITSGTTEYYKANDSKYCATGYTYNSSSKRCTKDGGNNATPTCQTAQAYIDGNSTITVGITNTYYIKTKLSAATPAGIEWTVSSGLSAVSTNNNTSTFKIKGTTAGSRKLTVKYKINGTSCTALTKTITVKESGGTGGTTTPTSYKLNYVCDTNDCTKMPSPNPQTSDTKSFPINTTKPERDGYQFLYWMINGGTYHYHPTCTGVSGTCKTEYTIQSSTLTTANLHAVWKKTGTSGDDTPEPTEPVDPVPAITEYSIHYDCGDDIECEGLPETTTSSNSVVAIDKTVPTREDEYKFKYWTSKVSKYKFCNPKTNDCDEYRIFFNDGVDSITLYANWEKIENDTPIDNPTPENPTNPDDGVEPAQTGEIGVIIFLALGLGMLGYSYYYTKKLKEN